LKFEFRPIEIRPIDEKLTPTAGLGTWLEMFDSSPLGERFARSLPVQTSPRASGSYPLALMQIASFLSGHDCLDDLETFRTDPVVEKLFGAPTVAARTMGDFLRSFTSENLAEVRVFLGEMGHFIRHTIVEHRDKPVLMTLDTSAHEQSGLKMQGLAINYYGKWCVDSQVSFDELGICYGAELRAGNTQSGKHFDPLLSSSFSRFLSGGNRKERGAMRKYFMGDSAYCRSKVILRAMNLGLKYTLSAHDGRTQWKSHIDEITKWEEWKWSPEELEWAKEHEEKLPTVEVGQYLWQPRWAQNIRIRVVVKRMWVERKQEWKYHGIVTNIFDMTNQGIVEHHNRRGNAENFIREGKYGFDLLHFPCQKLLANEAYLLLAMVAHNILRWAALLIDPHHTKFSKKFRRQFLFSPAKLVRHARKMVLKVSRPFYLEVTRLREAWQSSLRSAPVWATG
jgi:hypothetical protein